MSQKSPLSTGAAEQDAASSAESASTSAAAKSATRNVSLNKRAHLYVGRDFPFVNDIKKALASAIETRFDFIVIPLVHPRFRRDTRGVSDSRQFAFTRSDRLLSSSQWSTFVVGKLSPWFNFESDNATLRHDAEAALSQEIMWATHLSVPAVIAPAPRYNCFNYARALNTCIYKSPNMQIWVEVPLVGVDAEHSGNDADDTDAAFSESDLVASDVKQGDSWEAWNNLRVLCGHNPMLSVALVITEDVCSDLDLERWIGEPLRAVILPTSLFVPNRAGFPALRRTHQKVVLSLMNTSAQFIVRGKPRHEKGMLPYWQYIQHLGTRRPPLTDQEDFEAPFFDVLQVGGGCFQQN